MLGLRGGGELLAQQAGDEQHRAARPVVHDQMLGLTGGAAGNRDDNAGGLAVDLRGVVLKEAVVTVGAGVVEVLELVEFLGGDRDGTNRLRALHDAFYRRRPPA